MMDKDLYNCFPIPDEDDVDSGFGTVDDKFLIIVVLPTVAFVFLLIIVLIIYKKQINKRGQEPYTADVTLQGIKIKTNEGQFENSSYQHYTGM